MITLALDPSSTATGFAIFNGLELMTWGTERRNKRTVCEYAQDLARRIFNEEDEIDRVVYELSDRPVPRERQKPMRKSFMATGRILQALGVEGEPVKPDRKKKSQRRIDMELIYELEGRVSEHAIDAIALGHRVVNDPQHLG